MADVKILESNESLLHEKYRDISDRLDNLYSHVASLGNECTHAIIASSLALKIWAADINEKDTRVLNTLWKTSPTLSKKVDSGLNDINDAIDTLNIEIGRIEDYDIDKFKLDDSGDSR